MPKKIKSKTDILMRRFLKNLANHSKTITYLSIIAIFLFIKLVLLSYWV